MKYFCGRFDPTVIPRDEMLLNHRAPPCRVASTHCHSYIMIYISKMFRILSCYIFVLNCLVNFSLITLSVLCLHTFCMNRMAPDACSHSTARRAAFHRKKKTNPLFIILNSLYEFVKFTFVQTYNLY